MKVLAVNWLDRENPQAGGAEVHFFEIFRRLVVRGHDVTLITSGWKGAAPRTVLEGIEVRRVGGRYSFAVRGRAAVRQALREGGWDVLVEDINKLPLFLPTLTALPCYVIVPHLFGATVFTEASWPVGSVVWLAERPIPWVYRRAAFQAISESTREDLIQRGVRPEAIRVIYPGVDLERFTPGLRGRRAERPTFLYLGRLKRYKGLETAIRAVEAARAAGVALRLEIAGSGDDRERLEAFVRRRGLSPNVVFLGYVSESEKIALLRRAWAVVFPSAKEGWGMTNVEAAACGTPAVASDRPGLRESVRHGETGFLVPHEDPQAWAEALLRLARDPALVERLGTAARRFAESLPWEATATATERHLLEVVQRGPGKEEGTCYASDDHGSALRGSGRTEAPGGRGHRASRQGGPPPAAR